MKTQKLNIKVRDLQPLKDVTGGRHRRHQGLQALQGEGFVQRFADVRVGLRLPQ